MTRAENGPGTGGRPAADAGGEADRAARRHAPATLRNREPILEVLRRVLPASGCVLEVASGSGEHAAHFAVALPSLLWQPSDPDPGARASIRAWGDGLANLLPPLVLDAASAVWPIDAAAAVVCINMIHIAPWSAAIGLLDGAARILAPGAALYLYGPYRVAGAHTAPSNAAFDADLRARNPEWGVRDLDALVAAARDRGFVLDETVAMPANNLSVILRRA